MNAEVYGSPTDSLFAMSINGGVSVQPLFLYESVWMLAGLIGLLIYQNHKRRSGEIFTLYVIWYGIGRAVLESFRQDEYILKLFGMPISQVTAVLTVVAAVCVLIYLYMRKKPVGSRAAAESAALAAEAEPVPDGGADAVADNSAEEPEDTGNEPDESNGGGQGGTPE
ncbi:MAG TPA: prolipoprotein diacylglyceryl transferase [Candidatus Aphodoplasma excrementigallinarum]|uniref:Prolipoprotein diacylglyceryl transferase n=1 Tax=Candidatus Aphodoplasma excrementigallinarum TaxID=2840673 RepID=A0A9D1T0W1_9FIRM|nr:prolipoprotein diacylglyceryl transferase [Candidatus Aphodoplasma excrementigallinarum]